MERLNHQAELLLKKVTEEVDKHSVQDPLMELKLIWDSLDERIVSRQVSTKACAHARVLSDSSGKLLLKIDLAVNISKLQKHLNRLIKILPFVLY